MKSPTGDLILSRLRDPRLSGALDTFRRLATARRVPLYLAGGCVRDLLLGRPLGDLDLVVEEETAGLARDAAGRLNGVAHGPSPFGTCRLDLPGPLRIDLARSRRESYLRPAALPRVSPAPIVEDLLRRDFTINSMAVALSGPDRGKLLDPSGGYPDLLARRLRLHHPESLVDDPTRAFRAARYAQRYGCRMAPPWLAAIRAARRRGSFRRLTPARLGRELSLIWLEAHPGRALVRAHRWGLTACIDPALAWPRALGGWLDRSSAEAAAWGCDRASLCAALLLRGASARARHRIARRIGLAGSAARRVIEASGAPERAAAILAKHPGRGGLDGTLRALSTWEALPLAVAALASTAARGRRVRELAGRWREAEPLLTGEEIIALGIPRGPLVGSLLRRLRLERAAGRIRTRRQAAAFVVKRREAPSRRD